MNKSLTDSKPKLPEQPPARALPRYTLADASAIQALTLGTAEPEQQRRAIHWIIECAANTYGFHFHPTERDTDFALGRCFVGQQIVGLQKLNIAALRKLENET